MDSTVLFKKQNKLQKEAAEILGKLKLFKRLSATGKPIVVGSSAVGLMVRRDIDVTVVCATLDIKKVIKISNDLMIQKGVGEVVFRNDTGDWNTDTKYPDGLYIGIKSKFEKGKIWNIDIWFIDEPERQPDLKHLKFIFKKLNTENRAIILNIKTEWDKKPKHKKSATSYDIYDSVLNHNIKTTNEFKNWLKLK